VEVEVRMRETSGMTLGVVKAASSLIDRLGNEKSKSDQTRVGPGDLWMSIARYDTAFVEELERWERWSRDADDNGGFGRRRSGGECIPSNITGQKDEELKDLFKEDKWDKDKMVKSFGRLVNVSAKERREGKTIVKTLGIKDSDTSGLTLDVNREIRLKLHMGKVFMAWLWVIPVFHLPSTSAAGAYDPFSVTLKRDELDFPIGLGSSLISVTLIMERVRRDSVGDNSRAASVDRQSEMGDKEEPAEGQANNNKIHVASADNPDTPKLLRSTSAWRLCG